MSRKRMYSYTEKRQSQLGITSTVCGVLSILVFAALTFLAFYMNGQGGLYLGAIGIAGILFAVVGLIFGLYSFKEKYILHTFSKAGSILSGIMAAVWLLVILIGIG